MDNTINDITYLNERVKNSYPKPSSAGVDQFGPSSSLSDGLDPVRNNKQQFETFSNDTEDMAYTTLNDGSKIAKFENYLTGTNNEERLAQGQSTGEKWVNGAEKFFAKTAVAVLGGTVGVVNDLIVGVKEGSLSAAYNSDLSKWMDDLNTKLDYKLPNYYTEQEKEAGFVGSLGSANFWANDFLGGLSFTAGAIVSEGIWAAATGGTSLLAKGAMGGLSRLGAKALTKAELKVAGMAGKKIATEPFRITAKALSAEAKVANIVAEGGALNSAAISGNRAVGAVKALNTLRFTTTSAGFESAMEARHYMSGAESAWLSKFESENGRQPNLTEYTEFKDRLTDSGNAVFAANMVLVGSSNMVTFGKLAMGRSISAEVPNSWFSKNILGVGFKEGATKGSLEAIKATGKQKVVSRLYQAGQSAVAEGLWEEGGQAVASKTAENYMLNGYDKKGLETSYGMQNAFYDALSTTYGTKQGFKEVGLGMLIGVFGGGVSGALSGGGIFNEAGQQRKNIEASVDLVNKFHSGNLVDAYKANAKIYQAVEKSERANRKGDLVGQVQADREAMLSTLESYSNLGGVEFAIEQHNAAMEAVPNDKLAEELGITVEEAAKWKTQRISEYKELASEYELYSQYSESLLGDVAIKGMSTEDRNTLGKAITFNMVMGKTALKDSQNITDTIKRFVAAELTGADAVNQAIDTNFVLNQVSEEKTAEYTVLKKKGLLLESRQKTLLQKIVDIQALPNREDNVDRTTRLTNVSKELLQVEQEIEEVKLQKEAAAAAINVENTSNKTVTTQMLDDQAENTIKLKASLNALKNKNPHNHAIVEKLMQEQMRAIRNAKGIDATTKAILDPNTRYTLMNGWLASIIKGRGGKETDAEFFAESLTNYKASLEGMNVVQAQNEDNEMFSSFKSGEKLPIEYLTKLRDLQKSKAELTIYQQEMLDANKEVIEEVAVDSLAMPTVDEKVTALEKERDEKIADTPPTESSKIEEEYRKKIEALRPPETKLSQLKALQNKLSDILNTNKYVLEYFGNDVETRQEPTQSEIEEYQALQDQIVLGQEQNILYNDADNFTKEIAGINKEQIKRYQELNQKLNDWKTLDGTVVEGQDSSIADLLKIIQALRQDVAQDDTKTNFTEEEYDILVKEESQEWGSSPSTVKTPDNVLANTYKDKDGIPQISISFLSIESFSTMFPGSEFGIYEGDTIVPYEEEKHRTVSKKEGTKFVITQGDNYVVVTIGKNSRLIIPKESMDAMDSNLSILSIGVKNNNMVFEERPDGTLQMLESDFSFTDTEGKDTLVAVDKLNSMEKGDIVEIKIDREDAYNAGLLKEYYKEARKNPEAALEKLENSLSIYIYAEGSSELLGNLSAIDGVQSLNVEQNKAIRKEATKRLLESTDRYVNTGQKATVQAVLLGSPNIEAQRTENGPQVSTIPFTKEALQNVKGVGYIQGEKVTTASTIGDVNYTYVKALSRNRKSEKVPFVIVEYQGKNIAFPIKMTITEDSKLSELEDIMSSNLPMDQKALKVIELMQKTGIDPKQFPIDFSNTSWQKSIEVEQLANKLDRQESFITADQLASKDFDIDSLLTEAEIAVDVSNKPFRAGKMTLKLQDVEFSAPYEAKSESVETSVELENDLSDEAIAIYKEFNKVFYTIEDTAFVEAFDDRPVINKPKDFLEVQSNSRILKDALSGKAPLKVTKLIGKERIAKIKGQIARLDKLKAKQKEISLQGKLKNQADAAKKCA